MFEVITGCSVGDVVAPVVIGEFFECFPVFWVAVHVDWGESALFQTVSYASKRYVAGCFFFFKQTIIKSY